MGKVDCLFLHVPKLTNYYRPIGQFIWINFLPMGLLALADLLHRHDFSTQVLHLGVEWIEDRTFRSSTISGRNLLGSWPSIFTGTIRVMM